MSAALQRLEGDLYDVRAVLPSQQYLDMCETLQVLQESVEDEHTHDQVDARRLRALRRRAVGAIHETIAILKRIQENERRVREIEMMLRIPLDELVAAGAPR